MGGAGRISFAAYAFSLHERAQEQRSWELGVCCVCWLLCEVDLCA